MRKEFPYEYLIENEHLLSLIPLLQDRSVVIVVGAGLTASCVPKSRAIRPLPVWRGLLRRFISDCQRDDLNEVDQKAVQEAINDLSDDTAVRIRNYDEFFGEIKQFLSEDKISTVFTSVFNQRNYIFSDAYDALDLLDPRYIVSLNYDNFIEESFRQKRNDNCPDVVETNARDSAYFFRRSRNMILRLHGSTSLGTAVLSRDDYHENSLRVPMKLLESLARTHAFLFVGCSVLSDIDLMELHRIQNEYMPNEIYVYCPESHSGYFGGKFNLIHYSSPFVNDVYKNFSNGLMELGRLVVGQRYYSN